VAASRTAPSDSTARRCGARGWLGTAGWAVLGPGVHAWHSGPVQQREVVQIILAFAERLTLDLSYSHLRIHLVTSEVSLATQSSSS